MSRNHRINGSTPIIIHLVNVGMTDSAKLDVNQNVIWPNLASFKRKWLELCLYLGRRISKTFSHQCSPFVPQMLVRVMLPL